MAESIQERDETELEFYGFTLNSLKKEFEEAFRTVVKENVRKFTDDVLKSTKDKVPVETAEKLAKVAGDMEELLKPEIAHVIKEQHMLIEKYLSIPANVEIPDMGEVMNSVEMDDVEENLTDKVIELERIYKQQAVMIAHLKKEKEVLDKLKADAKIDEELLDILDESEAKNGVADVDAAVARLEELTFASSNSAGASADDQSVEIVSDGSRQ